MIAKHSSKIHDRWSGHLNNRAYFDVRTGVPVAELWVRLLLLSVAPPILTKSSQLSSLVGFSLPPGFTDVLVLRIQVNVKNIRGDYFPAYYFFVQNLRSKSLLKIKYLLSNRNRWTSWTVQTPVYHCYQEPIQQVAELVLASTIQASASN